MVSSMHEYSVITLNTWNTEDWQRRHPVFVDFFKAFQPDILALQEVRPAVLDAVSEALHVAEISTDLPAVEVVPRAASGLSSASTASSAAAASGSSDAASLSSHAGSKEKAKMSVSSRYDFLEDESIPGLRSEGNIFWRRDKFEQVAYSAVDVGIAEPERRLFWVLLRERGERFIRVEGQEEQVVGQEERPGGSKRKRQRVVDTTRGSSSADGAMIGSGDHEGRGDASRLVLVATVHLTWQGSYPYLGSDTCPRKAQMRRIVRWLESDEPLGEGLPGPRDVAAKIFGGDLNCAFGPKQVLRLALPCMQDSFSGLQLRVPITHPARPASCEEEQLPDQTLDWIFYDQRGIAPVMATRPEKLYKGRTSHVSDHYPLWFSFRLRGEAERKAVMGKDWAAEDPFFEGFRKYAPEGAKVV
eukprot:g5103.t1